MALSTSLGHDLAAPANGWLPAFRTRLAAALAYRTSLRALRALSDRELQDLGLTRADIPQVAYTATYGRR